MRILLLKPYTNTPVAPLPIGLLYVGTVLKKAGHSVILIDAHVKRFGTKKTISLIEEFNPDIIGITSMTSETLYMRTLARRIKENFPIKLIGKIKLTPAICDSQIVILTDDNQLHLVSLDAVSYTHL
ncbi:MAG: cobalamin B12-binding domain-containing protein, partial [Deltaproteobacteria bacterium]|nr:cobalamin B12-binding domain-containing protein [Deltaproteobacteria bacterium]